MNTHAAAIDVCSEDQGLLDIDTARARVAAHASAICGTEIVPIHLAGGRTLAVDVSASLPISAFDQSAMDGYAIALDAAMLVTGAEVTVVGRIAAGDGRISLSPGQAARIFTGAPLPSGASAVLMQEHGLRRGESLVLGRVLRSGENIRTCGEDIEHGEKLLTRGCRLDARHVALLAAQGRPSIEVIRRPVIAVISTGNELVQPGSDLQEGSVYDANRPLIMTLAREAGLEVIDGGHVKDDPDALASVITALARDCDLIVSTGGVSVGEEDHSAAAACKAGFEPEILRIALKPGKPAIVGKIEGAIYLGLPGNPVSAIVSWLILGGAAMAALEGRNLSRARGYPLPAFSEFRRRPGRTEFVPARIVAQDGGLAAEILGPGGSGRLRPMAQADGLVEVAALHAPVNPGDEVTFHSFRSSFGS